MTTSDIDVIARMSYERGRDPIEYAEACIVRNHLDVYLTIITSRAEDPATFPGYLLELTPEALARRIIGDLLDAGWASPAEGWAGPAHNADDMTDISESARVAYLCGVSPVGYAEHVIAGVFETHLRLVQEFTGCGPEVALRATGEMSLANLAHCLVGLLLNAGWRAPEVTS
jgi:hypothetical protein